MVASFGLGGRILVAYSPLVGIVILRFFLKITIPINILSMWSVLQPTPWLEP